MKPVHHSGKVPICTGANFMDQRRGQLHMSIPLLRATSIANRNNSKFFTLLRKLLARQPEGGLPCIEFLVVRFGK